MAKLLQGRRVMPLALLLASLAALAYAGWRAEALKMGITTNGTKITKLVPIGTSGTSIGFLKFGTASFKNASTTSESLTVTGLLPGDVVNVDSNTKPTNASYISGSVVTTNTLVVWYNTDPGTTITLSYIAMRPAS